MSHLRNAAKTGIVAVALGASLAATVGTASADPSANQFRTYSAVGSDTTQAVWNGLANPAKPAVPNVASYDATPLGDCVQTSQFGPSYLRPTGSGAGVRALSAAWDPANHSTVNCAQTGTVELSNADVAFSRSSSRPSSSAPGSDLVYIPFARDAVSVAINPAGTNTPTNLTTAQLRAIYGGADDNVAGTGINFNAAGKPVYKGIKLLPLLPQSSSGTRSFFLSAIGSPSLASYINAASDVVENDGSYLDQPGELIPFSAAQWIAQFNGVQANTTAGLRMTRINNLTPFAGSTKLTSGKLFGDVVNGAYQTPPTPGTGVFNRDTYNVVPVVYFGGTATQQKLLDQLTTAQVGALGNVKAVNVIKSYGFGKLGYISDQSTYLTSAFVH